MKNNKNYRFFRGMSFQIYIAFTCMVSLSALLVGVIFWNLYTTNYRQAQLERMQKECTVIAKKISRYNAKDKYNKYLTYLSYMDEMQETQDADLWIVANPGSEYSINSKYANVEFQDAQLTEEIAEAIDVALEGKCGGSSGYDRIYGMYIVRATAPILDKEKNVQGVVVLISMLERSAMSLKKGTYLIIISIVMALSIAYVIAMFVAKRITRSVKRTGKHIARLYSGDYEKVAIPEKVGTELAFLDHTLNELGERLANTEREREELDRIRQDFFANVSHELRTPITVMRGYTETLADGVITDPEKVQGFYERMLVECKGMERLVGDLFILSKLQNPDFEMETEPVNLVHVFHDVSRSAKVICDTKNIQLHQNIDSDICMILGDYDRLRQMFMIIIDNAVKFTEEGGNIYIKVTSEDKIVISVRDEGCGIKEEELPFIFDKFYKSKLRQNEKGSGLGLVIAKQIVIRHNGKIDVVSEVGYGTEFIFTFDKLEMPEDYE